MIAVKMQWYHKRFTVMPGTDHLKKSVFRKPPFRRFTKKDYSVLCPQYWEYPIIFSPLIYHRVHTGDYCYKCDRYKGIIFPGQVRCVKDEES